VPFDVGDAGVGFDSLDASSSSTTLVPSSNLVISGSGESRTLSITPAADAAGATTITVTATSKVGGKTLNTSDTFVLTVNALPTVGVTAPTDGSTFATGSAITIDASASDSDGGVSQVDFYRDDVLIGTDTTAPYSAAYSNPTVGSHSLTARATDDHGATTTSSAVSITVHDPPTVSVASPTPGSTFVTPSAIPITANASDDGNVTKVDFLHDGVLIGTDTTAPYSASYSSPTAGVHSLTARATDNHGATKTSSAVWIEVFPAATAYVNAVLADTPTAYWRLGEKKGTMVFDRTASKHTGGYLRSPTLGAAGALTGDSSKAVTFNGTTQYAQLSYRSALNPAPPYSIEAWAKVTGGTGTARTVVMSRDISPPRGYVLSAGTNDRWQALIGSGSSGWRTLMGPNVTLNAWTHLVVTVAPVSGGFQVRLYVDGAQAAQATFTTVAANTARPLRFAAGRTESTPIQFFPGTLDEIGFYNTALSATRVNAHHTTGKTG
jgi:hypothetical protein